MYLATDTSGNDSAALFVNPNTADNGASGIQSTQMFQQSPLFLNESLVAGESAGIPGLGSTTTLDVPSAPIASVDNSWWSTIKSDMSSAVAAVETFDKNIYTGVKDVTKTVYGDVSSGVGTVFDDVTKPITSVLTGTYWYLILAVVVMMSGILCICSIQKDYLILKYTDQKIK